MRKVTGSDAGKPASPSTRLPVGLERIRDGISADEVDGTPEGESLDRELWISPVRLTSAAPD
jgi:hypothetical protein